MSLPPPPIQAWRDMPPVWQRWFVSIFGKMGGSQGLDSGYYTPTLTLGANLDAAEARRCYWLRLKNTVFVSGSLTADTSRSAVVTQLGLALPVAPRFTSAHQCAGTGGSSSVVGQTQIAEVSADVANQRAQLQWVAGGIGSQSLSFSFAYEVE